MPSDPHNRPRIESLSPGQAGDSEKISELGFSICMLGRSIPITDIMSVDSCLRRFAKMRTMYRIRRRVVGTTFSDSLSRLWEGDELPTFRVADPYLVADLASARRVCWRLQARYGETFVTPEFPARPITYSVVPVAVKSSYYLPATGEPVTRRWVANALRQARRLELSIVSSSLGEYEISFGPESRPLVIRRLANVPAGRGPVEA